MRTIAYVFLALLSACSAAGENLDPNPESVYRLKLEVAGQIQAKILEPIMGAGKSYAFADFEPEVRRERVATDRHGSGISRKRHRREYVDDSFSAEVSSDALVIASSGSAVGFSGQGVQAGGLEGPVYGVSEQRAEQTKDSDEESLKFNLQLTDLHVLVICESGVAPEKLEAARTVLLAVYAKELKPANLSFRLVAFAGR